MAQWTRILSDKNGRSTLRLERWCYPEHALRVYRKLHGIWSVRTTLAMTDHATHDARLLEAENYLEHELCFRPCPRTVSMDPGTLVYEVSENL
jgi:hypothetical protein